MALVTPKLLDEISDTLCNIQDDIESLAQEIGQLNEQIEKILEIQSMIDGDVQ